MTTDGLSRALPPLAAHLAEARVAVLKQWERRDAGGHGVGEELLTSLLLDEAEPAVRYVDFNRREEGVVGADWLWWFVDEDGTCFGLLVQAKKLNGKFGRWTVDVGYPDGTQGQLLNLLKASDKLEVPSAYVVYFGSPERRPDLACKDDDDPNCRWCERASIAVLPALVARQIALMDLPLHLGEVALDIYRKSQPLEDLGLPDSLQVVDLNLGETGAELRKFMLTEQGGARGVAKRMFRVVSEHRRTAFKLATSGVRPTDSPDAIFDKLPSDTGHFGVAYFDHVLRGLRRQPPTYVIEILNGNVPRDSTPDLDGVAGIVAVRM